MNQSPEIASLIELLIDADPDSLLERQPNLVTPEQLWRATGEDMCHALKVGKHRPEVIAYLSEISPEEFIQENVDEWPPELVEKMVKSHPDCCLEYIAEKMTRAQKQECIKADLLAAAQNIPDELSNEQVAEMVEKDPKNALIYLHSRLDEETYQRLAFDHPRMAWISDPHRLNFAFIEANIVKNPQAEYGGDHDRISDAQIAEIVEKYPKFAWETLHKQLPRSRKHLIPEWKPELTKAAAIQLAKDPVVLQPFSKLKLLGLGVAIGLLFGLLIHILIYP